MSKISVLVFLMVVAGLYSCSKNSSTNDNPQTMDEMVVPGGFDFSTEKNVTLKISAFDNSGLPLNKIRYNVYAVNGEEVLFLQSIATTETGIVEVSRTIPSYFDTILYKTDYIGLTTDVKIVINNGVADNSNLKSGSATLKSASASLPVQIKVGSTIIRSLSGFNTNGVPSNLISTNDVIDASFLKDINASLPEYKPVPGYHPSYLAVSAETNVKLSLASDVWVTFVHEGAAYKNLLGFYKYNLSSPPAKATDIDSIFVIFPNASFLNSGGGLVSGNKVKIGTFKANVGIGWVLISDGFRSNTLSSGNYILYSNPDFNPETDATKRQHNVLLYDAVRNKVLLGFEDVRRDLGSDQDFNDAIFYVTSNPINAIENTNYPKITISELDTDNDGISDNLDDYPTDAERAFNTYYPSANTFGTLAFEDLWPSKGDYDMNDMVVDYRFNQVTNASNKVVEIIGKIVLKAAGASYRNGFGFSLPFISSKISLATGSHLSSNITTLAANGMENGTDLASFIVYDDNLTILPYSGSLGSGVNSNPDAPYVTPDSLTVSIKLVTPESLSVVGNPPYNPFIFVNQDRTKEVHLSGYAPTSKANLALFGTSDDRSSIGGSKLYQTASNLPWAINIVGGFDYPIEKTAIISAYTHFAAWAQSGGNSFKDWYKNLPGYRVSNNVYTKP